MEKKNYNPYGENLLAEVTEFSTAEKDGIATEQKLASKTNIEFFYGEVAKKGNKVTEMEEGDKIIFSQFAGYHLPTKDGYCKVILGGDIVAIVKDDFEKMEKVLATSDRVLVEIIDEALVNGGIYNDAGNDPRDADTQKGRVLHCGPKAEQFPEGTIVLFDPYCGNLILNEANKKLKTVNTFDILCTLDQ